MDLALEYFCYEFTHTLNKQSMITLTIRSTEAAARSTFCDPVMSAEFGETRRIFFISFDSLSLLIYWTVFHLEQGRLLFNPLRYHSVNVPRSNFFTTYRLHPGTN
jgi:hypothetical protein